VKTYLIKAPTGESAPRRRGRGTPLANSLAAPRATHPLAARPHGVAIRIATAEKANGHSVGVGAGDDGEADAYLEGDAETEIDNDAAVADGIKEPPAHDWIPEIPFKDVSLDR